MATPPRYLSWRRKQATLSVGLGWTTREVAEQFRVSPCNVRHWRTSPALRDAVAKAPAEVRQAMIARTVRDVVGAVPARRQYDYGEADPPARLRRSSGGRHE